MHLVLDTCIDVFNKVGKERRCHATIGTLLGLACPNNSHINCIDTVLTALIHIVGLGTLVWYPAQALRFLSTLGNRSRRRSCPTIMGKRRGL